MSEADKYDPNATNPMGSAQANMRTALLKRFYKQASVAEESGGFALKLDGRAARTPGKAPLMAPRRAIAERIAEEWRSQGEIIDPRTMLTTRLANSAIDGVAKTLNETRAEIAKYAGADLVCYRADGPTELVAWQAKAHEPVLAWARKTLDADFVIAESMMHVRQPPEALQRIAAEIERYEDPFAVAALHVLTSLSGSVLIALMIARGAIDAEDAWRAAHVEEDFQILKWGEDDEAKRRRETRAAEFSTAAAVIAAL